MTRSTSHSHPSASHGAVALACLLLLGASASAVSIPIVNHSFEGPDAAGGYLLETPTGWTSLDSNNEFVESITGVGMSGGDGLQYLGVENGTLYQDLGVSFQPGMTYRVDLASAHREGFTHGEVEFGVFSSDAIGTDLGTAGFMDIQGVWDGSGNPDGDNLWNVFRDASALNQIGSGALGRVSTFTVGGTAPTGNIVVFIRNSTGAARVNVDNIRLEEISGIVLGDVNGDGNVLLDDYAIIRDNFRMNVATRNLGDLSGDGEVDFTDFLEWRNNSEFGGLSMAQLNAMLQSVPEPTSALLVSAGVLGAATRRRRS